jgi:hypothetical protein
MCFSRKLRDLFLGSLIAELDGMNLTRTAWFLGSIALAVGAGCMAAEETAVEAGSRVTTADTQALLRSTLVLSNGCTAVKVGPKQLLLSARCVTEKPGFKVNDTIKFRPLVAPSKSKSSSSDDAAGKSKIGTKTGASYGDGGAVADAGDAGSAADAGSSKSSSGSSRSELIAGKIAKVAVHSSYTEKCKAAACGFGAAASSNAKDIAVLVLSKEIPSIKTVPIDLDPVSEGDELLSIGSGCTAFDEKPSKAKTFETVAAPAKSVSHKGSSYSTEADAVKRVDEGYVVTAGQGWKKAESTLCEIDMGAPLFRGHGLSVAGITSNFTARTTGASKAVPTTVLHTRVDSDSKVGAWLEKLGVETTRSCSKSADGCKPVKYEGGLPDEDGTSSGKADGAPGEMVPNEPSPSNDPPTGSSSGGGSEPPPTGNSSSGGGGTEPPPAGNSSSSGGAEPPPSGSSSSGGTEPPPSENSSSGGAEPPPSSSSSSGGTEPPSSDNGSSGGAEPPTGGDGPGAGEEGGGWGELPSEGEESPFGESGGDESGSNASAEEGDGGASGKKAPKASGCSAAPSGGSTSGLSGILTVMSMVSFVNAVRRRRRTT